MAPEIHTESKNLNCNPGATNVAETTAHTGHINNKNSYSNINIENIIGMTMWLSAVVESPGKVIIRHVQRGYPLKEVFPKMKKKADILREAFNKTCVSPNVENIHAEIFTKSLNALAFNLVALDREFNNSQLKNDKKAIFDISEIMKEGEQITKLLDIKLSQSIQERIEQTLSSTVHTMSMLNDFEKGKEIELKYLWESYKNVIDSMNIKMKHSHFRLIIERIFYTDILSCFRSTKRHKLNRQNDHCVFVILSFRRKGNIKREDACQQRRYHRRQRKHPHDPCLGLYQTLTCVLQNTATR